MEGVYRVNGGQLTMKKLRTLFDQGEVCDSKWEILFQKAIYEVLVTMVLFP